MTREPPAEHPADDSSAIPPGEGSAADLTPFLTAWPREAGALQVRGFLGADGRRKFQVRIELGVLQMEAEGRPDGERPQGFESRLHLELAALDAHCRRQGSETGFRLSPESCAALRAEALLYHQRAVAALALGEFGAVLRDAGRNLHVAAFCRQYARDAGDREAPEHLQLISLLLCARAEVAAALERGSNRDALDAVEQGLAALRTVFAERGEPERFEAANETQALRRMREMLLPRLPASQRTELEERLLAAIAAENYELASILRDELRQL